MGQLTRRSLLTRAVAGGGVLLTPRAGWALAGRPAGDVFAMDLPRRAFARAAGWSTTRPLRAPVSFDLVGIETGAGGHGEIELRVLAPDGSWGPWLAVPAAHGHGPDAAPARRVSDPVWTGPADTFQLRSSRPLRGGARVHFVDGSAGASAAGARAAQAPLPQLAAGPGQPSIIARSSWATAACRPRRAPYY